MDIVCFPNKLHIRNDRVAVPELTDDDGVFKLNVCDYKILSKQDK
jgi:hypothetical protein